MTDVNHNRDGKYHTYPDLNSKSHKEQSELREVWLKSQAAKPVYHSDPKEIKDSLLQVHRSLGFKEPTNSWWSSRPAKTILAAACLLLTVSLGYLSFSKKITVPTGQIKAITLPDGSKLTLNSGSQIKYNRLFSYFSSSRSVYLKGEAFFDIVSAENPFSVTTEDALIQVTGTQFNVRAWPQESNVDIAVLEGSIRWYPFDQPKDTIVLQAGQVSLWDIKTNKHQLDVIDDTRYYTGWKSNDFAFKNRSLQIIFNELERRFNVTIEFGPKVSPMQKLTTYYPNPSDAVSILEDICRVKGLKYIKTKNGFRVVR